MEISMLAIRNFGGLDADWRKEDWFWQKSDT